MTLTTRIAIIGSGFSGMCMGIKLKEAGFDDFVILEKAADLGGTWRDNTYPGCACDVPSYMYSFSFELNPHWTRTFPRQQEIWDYQKDVAVKYGLTPHFRFNTRVDGVEYDDATQKWHIDTSTGETYVANAVVSGVGGLHIPQFPSIPGRDTFQGVSFHSSEWDHSLDLTGKRVAVIGTGASAVQFIPQIAKRAGKVRLFQRTPPWIQPKPDFPLPKTARTAFRHVPGLNRTVRNAIYWVLESRALGFAVDPRFMKFHEMYALHHLHKQVKDPELRRKLTPDYMIGCKRLLLSNDYYPALARPNVDVITDGVQEITANSVIDESGVEREVDYIIYGTGFKVTNAFDDQRIVGENGLKIQEAFADGIETYYGITVAGFPNFFLLLGPNTAYGHTSVVFAIEAQVRYVMGCLRMLAREKGGTIRVKKDVQDSFNERLQERLRKLVWNEGGCKSWYLDEHGVNRTTWPGFSFEYWARTRKPRRNAYKIT